MENVEENLQNLVEGKILLAHNLIANLDNLKTIPGVERIQRKIGQEIKLLKSVVASSTQKLNHVMCSNLTHYEFLVNVLLIQKDVVHVDCGFPVSGHTRPLRVDIVCENGLKWIKVIARNTKALVDVVKGRSGYGAKSIFDQAEEFVRAAEQNLCMFQKPKVTFYVINDLDNELLDDFKKVGVEVLSIAKHSSDSLTADDDDNDSGSATNVSTLNLDITTMLAYISAVTNGSTHWVFKEKILTEQAEKEREEPLKPTLDKMFEGKRLICCETASTSFWNIVNLLAGPLEKERARALMARVEVYPDIKVVPPDIAAVNVGGKINPRSLLIFAFGISMKAVTATSNKGFIRSAKMQGVNIPVFVHQARALTESKELTAKVLD